MLCIITSGTENISLATICQHYDIAYEIIADTLAWPHDDKDHNYVIQRVKKIIETHQQENKGHLYIVSPSIELGLSILDHEFSQRNIFPLFSSYLSHCLTQSHSGRLGLLGGRSDLTAIEEYIKKYSSNYIKSDNQAKTKKFLFPFAVWTKEIPLWNYLLRLLSPRQMMINKIVKSDLKYLKDANVDTIIPLQYGYFRLQRTIQGFFNQKKQTFHGRDVLKKLFGNLGETHKENKLLNKQDSKLLISHTGTTHFIREKRREYMLSAGGKKEIIYKEIENNI